MALSLKDPETERLARRLAALTGETITAAIRTALAERLEMERRRRNRRIDVDGLLALGRELAATPDIDARTPDELCGYDYHGLWG